MLSLLLKENIALLVDSPGVYLMKDEDDSIIYVGKAKNLKKRVSQYFLRPQSGKVQAMVSHVDHFETIEVKSEKEAFILEMNLIKEHHPRYNILLMDDSHYPYIALKKGNDPLLKIARDKSDNRFFYFGPFPSSGSAYETIQLLNRVFPLRKCQSLQKKACLYYSLGQCLAPCVNKIKEEQSKVIYEDIKRFFNGDVSFIKTDLKKKMEEASSALEFERAGEIKKTLDSLEHVLAKQSVEISGRYKDYEVTSFSKRDGYICLTILTYRHGLLLGKKAFVVPEFGDNIEQIAELYLQYIHTHDHSDVLLSNISGLGVLINDVDPSIKVVSPKEGRYLEAIINAEINARNGLDAHFSSSRLDDDKLTLLEELGKKLNIKTPYRIELFDNSHLQGSSPVGAMVCYINGDRAKAEYRKFHLDKEHGGDDYSSMKEIISRRYSRLKDEGLTFPDLILADGGLPQVHACYEALRSIEVDIPVFGLYKDDKHSTSGLIDEDGNVIPLDNKSPLFFLLVRMQDEVHRYAISFHKAVRGNKMKEDILDDIKGIGQSRAESLRRRYPTLEALKTASVDELRQSLPDEVALSLFHKLHGQN